MAQRRAVITGIGLVNALGMTSREYFDKIKNGVSGVTRIQSFDPDGFPCQVAAEAPVFAINKLVPKAQRKSAKLMNRDIQLAVVASGDAMSQVGLKTRASNPDGPVDIDPARCGVNLGAGTICCDMTEFGQAASQSVDENGNFDLKAWGAQGMQNLTPLWMLKYLPNMLNSHVSIIYDLQGPSNSVTTAEVSALLSIGESYNHIINNRADLMIAGGGESKTNPMGMIRYCLMQRCSTRFNDTPAEACRPFDANANGGVLGEGAGVLVLEDLQTVLNRNASIYAEISGFGASQNFDTSFIEKTPDYQGTVYAVRNALRMAGMTPADIDLIIPCGLGVPAYDRAEAMALQEVMGDSLAQADILTTKWAVGACGAASGAIDVATAALCIQECLVPGNPNTPDPISDVKLNISTDTHPRDIRAALVLANTYGGQTAAIIIKKYS